MYTVSFRIHIPQLAGLGQKFYLNGSFISPSGFKKGEIINVRHKLSVIPVIADVIESVPTTRDPATFKWERA